MVHPGWSACHGQQAGLHIGQQVGPKILLLIKFVGKLYYYLHFYHFPSNTAMILLFNNHHYPIAPPPPPIVYYMVGYWIRVQKNLKFATLTFLLT